MPEHPTYEHLLYLNSLNKTTPSMLVTGTHVYFYTNYLSNWWTTKNIAPQFDDPNTSIIFNNTEEAFMWYKAHFFNDLLACQKIEQHAKAKTHPREVKDLGRMVRGYNDKAWSTVRFGFMTYVNLLKYQQNPDLAEQLKLTGGRILVEASPIDRIWGCGLAENDPMILDKSNWTGQNLLGKALMQVRATL